MDFKRILNLNTIHFNLYFFYMTLDLFIYK